MPIDNAFATHPGKAAEASEKKNEDFAAEVAAQMNA